MIELPENVKHDTGNTSSHTTSGSSAINDATLYLGNSTFVIKGGSLSKQSVGCEVALGVDCSNAENVALHNWSFKLRLEPHEGENGNLKKSVSTIREEFQSLLYIKHENIVSYKIMEMESFSNQEILKVYAIQDYVSGISLQQKISCEERVALDTLRCYTTQMLKALKYLHSENVVHGKFKASSVFLDGKGKIKVADFRIGKRLFDLYRRWSRNEDLDEVDQPSYCDDIKNLGDVALSLAMGKETTVSPSNLEWPVLSPVFVKFLGACRNENAEAHELLGHSYFTGRPSQLSRFELDFEVLSPLDAGGFGTVKQVKHRLDKQIYAVKRIPFTIAQSELSKPVREAELLSQINHKNVVRYYGAWIETTQQPSDYVNYNSSSSDSPRLNPQSERSSSGGIDFVDSSETSLSNGKTLTVAANNEDRYTCDSDSLAQTQPASGDREDSELETGVSRILYIQMECCSKGTLRVVLDNGLLKDDEPRMWKLFKQMLEGLGAVHRKGIIHRDVKPTNCFLDGNDNIKIGDFGLSVEKIFLSNADCRFKFKTTYYRAPEVLEEMEKPLSVRCPDVFTTKMDIYSVGIIFFEMCYSGFGQNKDEVFRKLRKEQIIFPSSFASGEEKDIIRWCLNHIQAHRPEAEELLEHVNQSMAAAAPSNTVEKPRIRAIDGKKFVSEDEKLPTDTVKKSG